MPYVNLLCIYIYALAVFNTKTAIHAAAVDDDDVVCRSLFLSFAPASITLHCEVLGVCQEQRGNTSVAFFLSFFPSPSPSSPSSPFHSA